MKIPLNIKHFLVPALIISFATILADRYFALRVNKTDLDLAYAVTTACTGLAIYLLVREINRNTHIRAELAVREEYLRETLNSVDEGVITTDINGIIQLMNPSAEKLTGWVSSEAQGKPLDMIYHIMNEQTGQPFDNIVKRILETGKRIAFENNTLLRTKEAQKIIISNNGSPIRDADGNIIGAVLVFRDVTNKKKAEQKVLQSEEKYRLIVETSQEAIWLIDGTNKTVFINKRFTEIFGYTFAEMIDKNIFDLFDEEGKAIAQEKIARRKQGIREQYEQMYIAKSGEKIWANVSASPIISESGGHLGSLAMINNISLRKKAEQQLKENYAALQSASEMQSSILDTLPANIALLDKNGVIIDVNQSWIKFGHENCLSGSPYSVGLNYIDEANKAGEEAGRQMADGIKNVISGFIPSFDLEYICHSPGKQKWYKAEVSPLIKKGRTGAVVMHVDITERKLAEIALGEMNSELEERIYERIKDLKEANSELEAFNYTVSHDLQAPLRLINGFAKILLSEYTPYLDNEGKKHLNVIADNAKKMNGLIKDLLAFAKLGKAAIEKKETDMGELVEAIVADVKLSNQDLQAEIILKELPTANCDPGLMKQVWSNLILNAVKYSKKKEKPVVEIGTKMINRQIIYYVQDNGVGFDMEHAAKLFSPFKRLHTDADFEGSGVGLATVHRILTRHGGEVWVDATVDQGATFYFTLPDGGEN